jgi:hypothetical protein
MTRPNTAEVVLRHIHGLVNIPTDRLLASAAEDGTIVVCGVGGQPPE